MLGTVTTSTTNEGEFSISLFSVYLDTQVLSVELRTGIKHQIKKYSQISGLDSEGHRTNDIVQIFCVTITELLIINDRVSGLLCVYYIDIRVAVKCPGCSVYTCLCCCKV